VPRRAMRGGRNWQPISELGPFLSASLTLPEGHPCTAEGPLPSINARGKGHSDAVDAPDMHSGSVTLRYQADGVTAEHSSTTDPLLAPSPVRPSRIVASVPLPECNREAKNGRSLVRGKRTVGGSR